MLFGQFLRPFHFFLDQEIISFITLEDLDIGKAASASKPLEHLCGSQRAYLFFLSQAWYSINEYYHSLHMYDIAVTLDFTLPLLETVDVLK
jgi:hypothetical protein